MKHDENQTCQIKKSSRFEGGKYIVTPCGRPTKGDKLSGLDICRTCLAGIKRSEQNANKGAEERRKEREFSDEVRALLEPLNISGHATGYRHRQLICSFDDLVKAFNKMRNCENCDAMYCTVKISPLHLKQDFYKKKKCIDENRNKWSEKHD